MILSAERVDRDAVPQVTRSGRQVRFDFIESASRNGTAYKLDGGGHFVIAPEDSLMPRFVVEISLERLGDVEYYNAVIQALNEHSCGFMWFDDFDLPAYDLAWRMRLPIIAITALFAVTPEEVVPEREGFELRSIDAGSDKGLLSMLLTTVPPRLGGLTTSQANNLLERGNVTVLNHENSAIGVLTSSTLSSGDVYVHAFAVAPEFSGMGVGTWFMRSFASQAAKGQSILFGMPNNSHAEFAGAMKLGAQVINRGWRAQLGSI